MNIAPKIFHKRQPLYLLTIVGFLLIGVSACAWAEPISAPYCKENITLEAFEHKQLPLVIRLSDQTRWEIGFSPTVDAKQWETGALVSLCAGVLINEDRDEVISAVQISP